MADKIFIRALQVPAQVGILPWEKTTTQPVVLDIEFDVELASIARADDIDQAVDYTAVSAAATSYLAAHRFNLVETLAEKLVAFLMEEFSLKKLRLVVTKPNAIANAQGVGVIIERARGDK